MKQVYLHIGLHKTGSTSLQRALNGYDDKKTRYASFNTENHSIPIYTIFSKKRYQYHIWKNAGLTNNQIDDKRGMYLANLINDLTDQDYENLIISGEAISILSSEEKKELIDIIKQYNINIKIIAYVRSPEKLAASIFNQVVKLGNNPKTINIAFIDRISPFISLVGKENIFILDYDQCVKKEGGIFENFRKITSINELPAVHSNESLTLQALAIAFILNEFPVECFGVPNRIKARKKIIDVITEEFSKDNGFQTAPSKIFKNLLPKNIINECVWLHENFGINYEYSDSIDADTNYHKYFENSLIDYIPNLKKCFNLLGHPYKSNMSVKENIFNLFMHLSEIEFSSLDKEKYLNFLSSSKEKSISFKDKLPIDFDPISYLLFNRDVLNARVDPVLHYLKHGYKAGRRFK